MTTITHKVSTNWTKERSFETTLDDHSFIINTGDNAAPNEWPSPKKLLLSSLAGCTGVDVLDILAKMRVEFTGLEMDTEADLSDEHPKVYTEIRLVYRFYGKDLDRKKVEKAVKLSQEKYCGVTAMLAKNCPVVYVIEYVES